MAKAQSDKDVVFHGDGYVLYVAEESTDDTIILRARSVEPAREGT